MNVLTSETAGEPLLFSWEPPRRRQIALATFLALSLVGHALCFYVFQIVYPPIVSLLPPPARVGVITSGSEDGRTLLRWIEAEDPALALTTQRPPEARLRVLPRVEHVPSYLAVQPALKEIPLPQVPDLGIPDSQPPGAAPLGRRRTARAIGPTATSVVFSKELEAFGDPTLPSLSFAASNNEPPQATRFRVAVSGIGEIRYCFPLNSSGDPALDKQARRYLMLCRFSKSPTGAEKNDSSLSWGIATIEWGSDVARHHPTPAEAASTP
jgi:hypothetical protein